MISATLSPEKFTGYALTGCAALYGFLQNGSLVDGVGKQLFIYIVKAQPADGIGKPLAGNPLVTEQENRSLHYLQHFFLTVENFCQRHTMGNLFTPAAPDINFKALFVLLQYAERTFSDMPGLSASTIIWGVPGVPSEIIAPL